MIADVNASLLHMDNDLKQNYKFHLGLDYQSEITQTVDRDDWKLDFITYSNFESHSVSNLFEERNISAAQCVAHLAEDIPSSELPFSFPGSQSNSTADFDPALEHRSEDNKFLLPRPWSYVPLYTNLYTTHVPATIHMNQPKERLSSYWDEL